MKAEDVLAKRQALKKRLSDFFNSDLGKELIEDLSDAFDPDDIVGAEPDGHTSVEMTYFNLGARSVARYVKNLREG